MSCTKLLALVAVSLALSSSQLLSQNAVPKRKLNLLHGPTKALSGYSYQSGNSYAEYRPGDKIAKYGLSALVIGGAAVGAAKLGLLTWLIVFLKKGWKLLVIGFAAVASFFRKLFTRKGSKAEQ